MGLAVRLCPDGGFYLRGSMGKEVLPRDFACGHALDLGVCQPSESPRRRLLTIKTTNPTCEQN